jgi:hypothetical protein
MATTRRSHGWLIAALFAVGCHAAPQPVLPPPKPPPPPPELPRVVPTSLEPDYRTLPAFDPLKATVDDIAPPPAGYHGLTEEVCCREAAARASVAGLFVKENRVPPPRLTRRTDPAADNLTREVRVHLAAEGRNRAAAEALDEFYQLADAEGRGEIMRATLPILDRLRERVRKARAEGLMVPVDPDELDRQRASLLGLIARADLGANSLDIDLKRRIGVPGRTVERLRPQGSFGVSAQPVDVDAAVRTALETRPDLLALREAYWRISPASLPAVREMLRSALGQGASASAADSVRGVVVRSLVAVLLARYRSRQLDELVLAELAVRRQQLYDLIAERERQAADEVRAAIAALNAQVTQVALARWRAEQLAKKVTDAKKQGPLAELAAELEAYRARTEVIAAVMAWHRARVKLAAAQGRPGCAADTDAEAETKPPYPAPGAI